MRENVQPTTPQFTLLDKLWYNGLFMPRKRLPYDQPTVALGKHGDLNLNLGRNCQPRAQLPVGTGALFMEGQDNGAEVGIERAQRVGEK